VVEAAVLSSSPIITNVGFREVSRDVPWSSLVTKAGTRHQILPQMKEVFRVLYESTCGNSWGRAGLRFCCVWAKGNLASSVVSEVGPNVGSESTGTRRKHGTGGY
jgi:hypothetical protein